MVITRYIMRVTDRGDGLETTFYSEVFEPHQYIIEKDNKTLRYNRNGFDSTEGKSHLEQWSQLISIETYVANQPTIKNTGSGYMIEMVTDSQDTEAVMRYFKAKLKACMDEDLSKTVTYYNNLQNCLDQFVSITPTPL